jgi:cysteine synthase A
VALPREQGVTSISDGGTLTGVGEVLKPRKPDLRIIAVEPENSPVISGGTHSPHLIQGIGAGFIPDVLDTDLIDEMLLVSNDEAIATARELARVEGIPGGISSGAALACAMRVAARDGMEGKTVVTVLPSFAERYLSTALFDGFDE